MNARFGPPGKPTGAALAVALVILAAQAAQDTQDERDLKAQDEGT